MRLFRLFTLMDQLRVRTLPVPARELAASMNVSIRSIYRDIADLQAMGAPIHGEGGIGYVMERGYFMPSLAFAADELDALALGLKLVNERSSAGLAAAAERALSKIASAVGAEARQDLLEATLAAGPSAAGRQARSGRLYDDLRASIVRRDRLKISYIDGGGKKSERLARPLGLTSFDSSWLLTIWCELTNAFRHLRLDRIVRAEPTGETFRHERGKRFSDALKTEREKLGRTTR
jgi:predicted DNA-binding transcriptional regulator YafY